MTGFEGFGEWLILCGRNSVGVFFVAAFSREFLPILPIM